MLLNTIKYTYSFDAAQKKIATFTKHHYILISNITEQLSKRPLIRSAQFLLKKEDNYYQYKTEYLFANERSATIAELQNDLVPIINQEYIYVILYQPKDNRYFIILRENSAISGHDFLIRPYKQDGCMFTGGELYFYNKRPLLINNKSGSFQTRAAEAAYVITKAFNFNEDLFHPAVEKKEVDAEIAKRREKLQDTKLDIQPQPRPQTFFYQRSVSTRETQTNKELCSCVIL